MTPLQKALQDAIEALENLYQRDQMNTCQHAETHRGGAIWEICDGCGAKWADDRGGKPKWKNPPEWDATESAITQAKQALDHFPDAGEMVQVQGEAVIKLIPSAEELGTPQASEPAGWKLVPVEPTPEMCDAGADYMNSPAGLIAKNAHYFYKAMLAAAPKATK